MGGRKGVNKGMRFSPRVALEASLTLTREPEICFAVARGEKQSKEARGKKGSVFRNFRALAGFPEVANLLWRGRSDQQGQPRLLSRRLLCSGARPAAAEHVVNGDGAGAEEDQSES